MASDISAEQDMRGLMKSYWTNRSDKLLGNQSMLTDTNADQITLEEVPEILSFLPDWRGKRILELAGGIGRFTGFLADQADHVTTVDFVDTFLDQNKEKHKDYTNITYVCDDVFNLNFEKNSFDVVFSSWLLAYFCEKEVHPLLRKAHGWLNDDGYMFFRETCYKRGGNITLNYNPAFYRTPTEFNQFLQNYKPAGDGEERDRHLEMIFARPLLSYIKLKDNRNQVCWLLQNKKVSNKNECNGCGSHPKDLEMSQDGKDSQQPKYDQIKMLDLKADQKVLDVGCGNGDRDFYMTTEYGVDVIGVHTSWDSIEAAWDKKGNEYENAKICFELGDITQREFPPRYFDAIIVEIDIADVTDKTALYDKFMRWLKADGKLLVRDFSGMTSQYTNGDAANGDVANGELHDMAKAFPDRVKIKYSETDGEPGWFLLEKNV